MLAYGNVTILSTSSCPLQGFLFYIFFCLTPQDIFPPELLPSASRVEVLEEEKEERSLIIDLKRHARLAVAWNRHGSLVPRWT